ncbi:MAG TPA: MFS transporter [Candidatus Limnocylindrales bacterium]|nr:MFS transporter [Candidatus Limnocylindrales bacterium]
MGRGLIGRSDPALGALRTALGEPAIRQLMVAWFAANAGQWALLVINLVVAYQLGGAVGVGAFGLARYLLPTILAPFVGLPVARWPTETVLRGTNVIRTVAVIGLVAVAMVEAPLWLMLLLVAVEASAGGFTRPLHMGLLPGVARTPEQLIGANVTSGAAEGLGTFVGPALASVLLVVAGPVEALIAVIAIDVISVVSVARLHVPSVGRSDQPASVRAALAEVPAGVRAVATIPGLSLIIGTLSLQTFVRGLLTVLIVVASIELLGLGEAGVGTLNALIGLGGLFGSVAAITLAGRDRLGPPFALALASWGAPIAVVGLLVDPVVAMVAMGAVGVSNAVLDVAGFTLIQRMTPNAARVAVLGIVDSAANGGPAIGGLIAPLLIAALGIKGALIVAGAVLPVAAILTWRRLRRLDEGGPAAARRVELLRSQPLFAPLSLATIEHLAGSMEPVRFEAGAWLMREGDQGDRYVLIDRGEADVSRFGEGIGRLGPGDGAGEIALVHDVPRTASIRASTPIEAFALARDDFLEAVTGHPASRDRANELVRERLVADFERET